MSPLPVHRQPRSLFPDVWDMFADRPPMTARSVFGSHLIRVEDLVEDGHYTIRAELPGIDPAKDVDITVRDGVLTIRAERTERKQEKSHHHPIG